MPIMLNQISCSSVLFHCVMLLGYWIGTGNYPAIVLHIAAVKKMFSPNCDNEEELHRYEHEAWGKMFVKSVTQQREK